ncbi:unnamed protein product, partial [Mesorhabditis belari]|uniref:Uncharacterized protein n=1 Tax=Mesorhabditis belari TaxID=2138241 RepID=A0AAF3FRD7_9BILA
MSNRTRTSRSRSREREQPQRGNRDTAKDIILGLAPSGQGPRKPKTGTAHPPTRRPRRTASSAPIVVQQPTKTIVDRRPDNKAIDRLNQQIADLQKQNKSLLSNETEARRRLERDHDDLKGRLRTAQENGVKARDVDDLRREMTGMDGKLGGLNGDLSGLKSALDRQTRDLAQLSNELKQRPVVDPNKIADASQKLDEKVRGLGGTLGQLQKQLEKEQHERERADRASAETIQRLQEIIREQDRQKQEVLGNLAKKGDRDKEKLSEETKRLNDKIHLITNEVTKSMNESQQKLRDDMNKRFAAIEAALKQQADVHAAVDDDLRRRMEVGFKTQADQIDALGKAVQNDRNKNKERFQKVNEALAALEHHLELGNKKLDKMVTSEMQNRKLHEKGLLSKVTEIEERLNGHTTALQKSMADVEKGKENVKVPQIDFDAMRREMEAIAADKNKLSMEGLLLLEEKMSKVQQGLYKDKRDLNDKLAGMTDSAEVNKLKKQVDKLDDLNDEMEETQDRIRDKVEKQIPQDLNELSAKADNIKHQLNARIDKEEEERYLAIKELQEAFVKLQQNPAIAQQINNGDQQTQVDGQFRRDLDESKIAIRKLAESVTTVKNVLDKKITDEIKMREADVARLDQKIGQTRTA